MQLPANHCRYSICTYLTATRQDMKKQALTVALVLLLALGALAMAEALLGGVSGPQAIDNGALTAASRGITALNAQPALLATATGKPGIHSVELVTVKSVRTQVVQGINYFLTVEVKDCEGSLHDLDIVVWSRPWLENKNTGEQAWQLTSAKPAPQPGAL